MASPRYSSRTVRIDNRLIADVEAHRARVEERAGVPVDLRTVVEALLRAALEANEQKAA